MNSTDPILQTAPHELHANLIYGNHPSDTSDAAHGLSPYFAFLNIIRNNNGSKRYSLEFRGMTVSGKLYYQESGIHEINHPDADQLGTIIEPRISWEVTDQDDPVGERSGNFHITPRAPDMRTEDGNRIQTPTDLLGINVSARGSNLDFDLYPALFRLIAAELGITPEYFRVLHEYSNIEDAARYVRVNRDKSGGVHAIDGILRRINNLLANDREGYRKHVADDTIRPGYYHAAMIGSKRAAALIDGHRYAKEFKHYLPREPDSYDEDHPLYHPKIEVSYQVKRDDRTSVPWVDLRELNLELDEALINLLHWEDLPVTEQHHDRGGPPLDTVYVDDQYFHVDTDHRPLTIIPDPTPSLKNEQQSIVIKHLKEGLAESEYAIVEELIYDGGYHSPKDLADETEFHLDTIYRAMKRIPELIEHTYNNVALKTPYIAEQLVEVIERAEDTVAKAVETSANALSFAAEDIESSSLVKWLRAHHVDIESQEDGRLMIRMGISPGPHTDDVREALLKGYDRWVAAGRNPARFKNATVKVPANQLVLTQALL